MKELYEITEEEVRHICDLVNEPYLRTMVNDDGKWEPFGEDEGSLMIQITTTCTSNGDYEDGSLCIFQDGKVYLSKNTGDWGGHSYKTINCMLITDYLRSRGYYFTKQEIRNKKMKTLL